MNKNRGNWFHRMRFVVWFFVFIVVLLGGLFFLVNPLHDEQQRMMEHSDVIRDQLQKLNQEQLRLAAEEAELPKRNQYLGRLLANFPAEQPVAKVVQEISTLGQTIGLTFVQIKPEVEHTTSFYAELPLTVVVVGTYTQLGMFVSGIASLPEPVIPGDFTLAMDHAADYNGALKMTLNLRLLRVIPDAPVVSHS